MSFKVIKVGRAKDNDIVLEHASVSRYHCEFFYDAEGNVFLTDKKSANGTFVNGRKINDSVKLEPNDIVKTGLDVPLRWRNFNSNNPTDSNQTDYSGGNNTFDSANSSVNYQQPKKMNSTLKTVLITILIVGVAIGLWFIANEYILGNGKPDTLDPEKPNDKTEQPDKVKKSKEIQYDFSCLDDEDDFGTTGIINVLETVESEATDVFGEDISIAEEEEIGQQLLRDCRMEYSFIETGFKIENLKMILKLLTNQLKNQKGFHYQIFLIESAELNAFTAGAKIFITTRMYSFCKTNDELALIIGHEINHNELGHIKESMQKERLLTAEGAALAKIATISFGQKKETHCDMTGIDLAIAAGYNGCLNIELWQRMQKESEEGEYNVIDNLLRSHPYSEKRSNCSRQHILNNYDFDCTSNKD